MSPSDSAQDRRRDRRHSLSGYAILRSRAWSGTEVFGGLLDVSAGGARVRVRPGTGLVPGQVWALDLEIAMPQLPTSIAPVRLWGTATVLRYDEAGGAGIEAALRFETPLQVVEGFTAVGSGAR